MSVHRSNRNIKKYNHCNLAYSRNSGLLQWKGATIWYTERKKNAAIFTVKIYKKPKVCKVRGKNKIKIAVLGKEVEKKIVKASKGTKQIYLTGERIFLGKQKWYVKIWGQ